MVISVSKTTKELILSWDSNAQHEASVSVAQDLRMPQFEMQRIRTNRCHETNHMGNYKLIMYTDTNNNNGLNFNC